MDRSYHYRKAEECAEWAHQLLLTGEGSQDAAVCAAIAQAHATLARAPLTGTGASDLTTNTTWQKPPAEEATSLEMVYEMATSRPIPI